MSSENIPSEPTLKALLELGAKAPQVINAGNDNGKVPLVVIPNGQKVESLAAFFPPQRIKQGVVLLECSSFIAYVNRFKTPDTLIFANLTEDGATFRAVLDYHASNNDELAPGYCAHTALFETIKTPEFAAWLAHDGKEMTQGQFASFLEDNAKMFTDPKGADLLELVQTLTGKQDVTFTKGINLTTGAQKVQFNEVVELAGQNRTQDGQMELPKQLTATFPVYQGSAAYVVRARLKYRINSTKLVMWYETIEKHLIVRDACMSLVTQIARPADLTSGDHGPNDEILAPGTGILPLLGRP